jgi:hypothetical protein
MLYGDSHLHCVPAHVSVVAPQRHLVTPVLVSFQENNMRLLSRMNISNRADQTRLNILNGHTWRTRRDDVMGKLHFFLEMNLAQISPAKFLP